MGNIFLFLLFLRFAVFQKCGVFFLKPFAAIFFKCGYSSFQDLENGIVGGRQMHYLISPPLSPFFLSFLMSLFCYFA